MHKRVKHKYLKISNKKIWNDNMEILCLQKPFHIFFLIYNIYASHRLFIYIEGFIIRLSYVPTYFHGFCLNWLYFTVSVLLILLLCLFSVSDKGIMKQFGKPLVMN